MALAYSAPKLTATAHAAVDRGDFDFLVPYKKPLYRTDEAADTISRSTEFIRCLIEEGRLEAHRDSATTEGRKSSLVTRRSLLLYQVSIANYDPNSIVARLEAIAKTLGPAQLDRFARFISRQRESIS
jgi:hypothetical protein